jgi:hypothetical protein
MCLRLSSGITREGRVHEGKLVFAQVMEHLPWHTFRRCVERYNGHRKVKSFTCVDHFLCMAFAQLTYRESLRDIESCLTAYSSRLHHMGIRSRVRRNTLSNANNVRSWRIYADFGQRLIEVARRLYADEDFGLKLAQTAYALDSTVIDLCLSLFPWTPLKGRKAAVKVHTLLDLRGPIPAFIRITNALQHDIGMLDVLVLEAGAIYVMDRGYLDFERLYRFTKQAAFFVTRARANIQFRRQRSRPVDRASGLICDQIGRLNGKKSSSAYPDSIRRVKARDLNTGKTITLLTNNFTLDGLTIAELYRSRWKVELFFKWIKQNLRIKAFYGRSENAVRSQIWIAISVYVLIAIIRKRLNLDVSLYSILQILSVTPFEKRPLSQLLSEIGTEKIPPMSLTQLNLFT